MEVGTVTACMIGVNRDGLTPVRLVTCMVSGPTDLRTVQLGGSIDHWPVPGAKVRIEEIESSWEVGEILEDILPAATTLIGDKVIAANAAVGVPSALSQISLRAAAGGSIELGGATDFVTAFTDMKTAFDALRGEINAAITIFNAHTHSGVTTGSGSTGTTSAPMVPAAADMTGAMVATVKVP